MGRLDEALSATRHALALDPGDAEALSNLGVIFKDLRNLADAEASCREAIRLKPDYSVAYGNLGNVLREQGRLDEAEATLLFAIRLTPDFAEYRSSLGNVLLEMGRAQDAEAQCREAIRLKPGLADAHYNLGNALLEQGRLLEAEASYRETLRLQANHAKAHNNLGVVLKDLGRVTEAEASYRAALGIQPIYPDALRNLAHMLLLRNDAPAALEIAIRSIREQDSAPTRELIARCLGSISSDGDNAHLLDWVTRALLEAWAAPASVVGTACRLLLADPAIGPFLQEAAPDAAQGQLPDLAIKLIAEERFPSAALFKAILVSAPVTHLRLEGLLTQLRAWWLDRALEATAGHESDSGLSVACALAQQCFINEYVYFDTREETERSSRLRDMLVESLRNGWDVPASWIAAVACYFPLHTLGGCHRLLDRTWSDAITALLVQQIREPLEERSLKASIPTITPIRNRVSRKVGDQYEEHPYPRWVRSSRAFQRQWIDAYLCRKFPSAGMQPIPNHRNPSILIAGCGTGQHSIGTAQMFKGAAILAIDLSTTSLAYAKRKTKEYGIEGIEYARADILELGSMHSSFDVIESVGVLHHLENPYEGWRVLLSLLRPQGVMRLGLYSEIARRDIVRVRALFEGRRLEHGSREIREARRSLLGRHDAQTFGFATSSSDFFSTSGCRDLLFHVHEHLMNWRSIKSFLNNHQLRFLGVEIDPVVVNAYRQTFPGDLSATDLDGWHAFEVAHPETFVGMYQFWIQKTC